MIQSRLVFVIFLLFLRKFLSSLYVVSGEWENSPKMRGYMEIINEEILLVSLSIRIRQQRQIGISSVVADRWRSKKTLDRSWFFLYKGSQR